MIINQTINTNLEVNTLMDLSKLKELAKQTNIKVNFSEIARDLKKDRRTVIKYFNGFKKMNTKKKQSQFDEYYETIKHLLCDEYRLFVYKSCLFNFMKDNHNMKGAASSFRRYLSKVKEFDDYFKSKGAYKPDNTNNKTLKQKQNIKSASPMRFETSPGQQAQIDWKESQEFITSDGEVLKINVFVFLLSNSRFKIFHLSLLKTQEVLFHFLDKSFEIINGVPETIVTDNMKTVMDKPRTKYSNGSINDKFKQFADDYGFHVHACIAGRPETKSKVETQMKVLDEIKAYNTYLTYKELNELIQRINERENNSYHPSYKKIPIQALQKEKAFLSPLPHESIRKHNIIKSSLVKVNKSSMFNYKNNQYSVLPEYIGKLVEIEVIDNLIYVYYNKKMITIHSISKKTLNYDEKHYVEISKLTLNFNEEKIEEIARENLKKIGESFKSD